MPRNLSFACLLLAWLCANGAVWNVVQVVGWAKMFRDYARVMPAAQAFVRTFDGSEACSYCRLAEAGQEATRDPAAPVAAADEAGRILLIAESMPAPVLVVPLEPWPGVADVTGRVRTEAVPVPPPRV